MQRVAPHRDPSDAINFQGFWKSSISSLVVQIESYNVKFFDRTPNFDRDKWTRQLQIEKDERGRLLLHFCRRNHVLNRGQTQDPESDLYRAPEQDSIFWVSDKANIRWNRLECNEESMLQMFFVEFLGLPSQDSKGWIGSPEPELCPYASHWKHVAMQFENPWIKDHKFKKGDRLIVTEDFPTDDIHTRFLAERTEVTVSSVDFAGSIGVTSPGWLTTHWVRRKKFDMLKISPSKIDGSAGPKQGLRQRFMSTESMISLLSDEDDVDPNMRSPIADFTSQIFDWDDLDNIAGNQNLRPALTPKLEDLPDYEDLYKWIEYDHPNIRRMRESFDGITLLMLQGKWELFEHEHNGWNKQGKIEVSSERCLLDGKEAPFQYIEGHYYWNDLTIKTSKDSDDLLFAQPNGRVMKKWQKIQKPKLDLEALQGDWYIFGEKYQPGDWLVMGLVTISGTNCYLDNGNHTRLTKSHGENQMFYFMDMPIALQTDGVLLLSHPSEDFNLIWQRADLSENAEAADSSRMESPQFKAMEGAPTGAVRETLRESFQLTA